MTDSATWCLRGALLPDRPECGSVDIAISGEVVVAVQAAGTFDSDRVVDATGSWVLPGVVDAHVHPVHAETFGSVGEESLPGGITTVLNHLYPAPGESLAAAVTRATDQAALGGADFGFHLRITPDRISGEPIGLREAAQLPGVLSVKIFLAHSIAKFACDPEHLVPVFAEAAAAGLPVIVHAELGAVISALTDQLGEATSLAEHDRLRSAEMEAAAVATAAAIAQIVGSQLYVAHLSSPEAVAALRRALKAGTRVRGETCPHYLFLNTDHRPDEEGRVTPPLRSAEQAARMRSLVAAGDLDVIASDHCGYEADDKPANDFTHSDNGLPGLDTMLPLFLDALIGDDWIDAATVVHLLCSGPARTFGVQGKGYIDAGADADLVIVDPAGSGAAAPHPPGVATASSPYGGRRLKGLITDVVRRGSFAVRDGSATGLAGAKVVRSVPADW